MLEQIFRERVRLDRVQDDADAFRQLIEERLMRRVESLERRELHHRFDLAFEEDRQHNDVVRRRFAEPGADLHIIVRHVREEDALFLQRGLADQAFAELEAIVRRLCARDTRSSRAASAPVLPASRP